LLSGARFEELTVEVTHVYPAERILALADGEAEAPRAVPVANAFSQARANVR
jgi:hypothetical protein